MIAFLKNNLEPYRDKRQLVVLYLGFASGLPLLLTLSTLSAWLKESGVSIQSIGLFALVGLPYTLKFLWAPLMDAYRMPYLARRLGRRLGWLFITQIMLAACLFGIGCYDPQSELQMVALFSLLIAFASASQDIVSDAYRIELQEQMHLGAGAAVQSLGYRAGMLIAGAGALYLAVIWPWGQVYQSMGAIMLACALICLFCPKSKTDLAREQERRAPIIDSIWHPLRDFINRPGWLWIGLFVLLYKLGDALATSLATPFYLEIGFTKPEIATITKIFGPVAFLIGGFIGGALTHRIGLMRALMICGVLQLLSNFLFAVQAAVGHDISMLTLTIAGENIAGGMGSAAFVAYLSALCNLRYTATQFALLTSLMAVGRTLVSSGSGFVVAEVGWIWFYVLTAAAAVPGLIVLWWVQKNQKNEIAD